MDSWWSWHLRASLTNCFCHSLSSARAARVWVRWAKSAYSQRCTTWFRSPISEVQYPRHFECFDRISKPTFRVSLRNSGAFLGRRV